MAKVEACRNYGAATEMAGEDFEDALDAAIAHVEETGGTFIHPYEDQLVVAGQGTIGLELLDQEPDVGTVLIPIGGGGLALGIATALRALKPEVRIVGVRAGVDGYTIADGIAVKVPSDFTMPLLEDLLDDIVAVTDEQISEAIVLLLERAKLVVEGAGAVGVAALLAGKDGGTGTAVPILSGGNIDPTMLISVMRHGLSVGGPLSRDADANPGPAGRADQAALSSSPRSEAISSRSSTTVRAWICRSLRPRSS